MKPVSQTLNQSSSSVLLPLDRSFYSSSFSRFLYFYLLFVLFEIFTTSNAFAIETDLFFVHLAGVKNPLIFLIFLWFLSKVFTLFRHVPRTNVDWFIFLMLVVELISSFFSSNPAESGAFLFDTLIFTIPSAGTGASYTGESSPGSDPSVV